MLFTYFTIGILVLILLNIFAMVKLIKSSSYSKNQKIGQIFIIWLLPIFGAFLVIIVIKEDKKPIKRKSKHTNDHSSVTAD